MTVSKIGKRFSAAGPRPGFANPYPGTIYDTDGLVLITNQYKEWTGVEDWFSLPEASTPSPLEDIKVQAGIDTTTRLLNGANCNIFFCPSLTRNTPGVYVYNSYFTRGSWALIYKFSHLDSAVITSDGSATGYPLDYKVNYKSPFGFQRYGQRDEDAKNSAYVPVTNPSPLPTWTFDRSGGYIFNMVVNGTDPDVTTDSDGSNHNAEGSSPEAQGFYGTGELAYRLPYSSWWGGDPLTFNVSSWSNQILGPFGAGTTRAINPQWYSYNGGFGSYPGTPRVGDWKTSVMFGVQPAAGQTLTWQFGCYKSDGGIWSHELRCDNTTDQTPFGVDVFPASAGDAILIIAINPGWSNYDFE